MADWLEACFGKTLCALFFFPFHEHYTAGLYHGIAPQDAYKSPPAIQSPRPAGYNVTFLYPDEGLDHLARALASGGQVHYSRKAVHLDLAARNVGFDDGTEVPYDSLVTTLPLNRILQIAGLKIEAKPDPYTSVLVLNIGAVRGPDCPGDHWIYYPHTRSGFHRVGFYSNVSASFLPASRRAGRTDVGIYVERAYPGGARPGSAQVEPYAASVVRELQEWGYIGATEVLDPTWIDVAYTWRWPESPWVTEALSVLERHAIYPVGRYARWRFQGIADSIRDGLAAGTRFRELAPPGTCGSEQ